MAVSRRDFIKQTALILAGTAGASALSIEAFERLIGVNTPMVADASGLIVVRELLVGFAGNPQDAVIRIDMTAGDRHLLQWVMNQRTTLRWVGAPDCPFIVPADALRVTATRVAPAPNTEADEADPPVELYGTVIAVNAEQIVQSHVVTGADWVWIPVNTTAEQP